MPNLCLRFSVLVSVATYKPCSRISEFDIIMFFEFGKDIFPYLLLGAPTCPWICEITDGENRTEFFNRCINGRS